ncbi:glycosyltransferase [Pacificimonas sp. WHA3]|uniref:Glycosyltransferase n=1 Tax=Pacificimonas pallii TaxID=2827236 RepID=A0ABS6SGP7_9SPHN|nr:glycosyltransferase [Pacificimonas pallii]MBV7257579.1 glycosyltransferase [Pacificimonas pallii]
MSVYRNDTKNAFAAAVRSVVEQEGVERDIRIYLAIDGPLNEAVSQWIFENEDHFYVVSRSARNIGLAKSLNRLIGMLGNENYVFRMDSDDLCLANRFSLQIDFLDGRPDVDILGGAIIEHDVDSGALRLCHYPLTHSDIVKKMVRLCPFAHPTVVFRRKVLTSGGGYPEMMATQDLAMWFACLQNGARFANLPAPLVIMDVSRAFLGRRSLKKGWHEFGIYLNGILDTRGYSWTIIYPLVRLVVRSAPVWVRRLVYRSSFRRPQTTLGDKTQLALEARDILGKRQQNV